MPYFIWNISYFSAALAFWDGPNAVQCISLQISPLLTYHFVSRWILSTMRHQEPELHDVLKPGVWSQEKDHGYMCLSMMVFSEYMPRELNSVTTLGGGGRWEMGGYLQREGTYVYMWLIHADVKQKPTQYSKAIILQLKKRSWVLPSSRPNLSYTVSGTSWSKISYLGKLTNI